MLRLSSYLILSECLENGGYAALSGLSGNIELISEGLYQLLKAITGDPHSLYIEKDYLPSDILAVFVKRGHITEASHEEERSCAKNVASALHELRVGWPGVMIIPDLDCNYRCVYCFEKNLQSGLKSRRTKMDKTGVDAVYRSIDQLASEVGPVAKGIILYGGEPLRAENREVVEYIVEKGVERGHRFTAITNGHDLEVYMKLLREDEISFLQITIDGPQDIHDKRRIAQDGSSSFQKIIKNIRQAIEEANVSIGVRVNLDEGNYRAFGELMNVLDREGWLSDKKIFVHAAIVEQKDQSGAVFPVQDINILKAELHDVANRYPCVKIGSSQSNSGASLLSTLLSNKPFEPKSCFCSANSGMYIFLPDGTISSCWDSLGEKCSYIGSYSENGLFLDKNKTTYKFNRSVANIPACLDCKYCFVCAGGCAQFAEYNYHDIYKPYCGDFPETYPWVLAEAVEKYLKVNSL